MEKLLKEKDKEGCVWRVLGLIVWTVYGDHQRFIDTYFSQFDGKYFTGDGCKRDKDGYYWITGRVDDVIIVSGHNLGTAEIESAFVAHPKVAEAAVVGFPHSIKGNGLYCYVTLNAGENPTGDLERSKTMGKKTNRSYLLSRRNSICTWFT